MFAPKKIPVLIFDEDPNAIEDFKIVLDPSQDIGDGYNPMGAAFEAALIGSCSVRGRFPKLDLAVKRNGHEAIEATRHAIECGQPFRIAFIDIGVAPGHWGLDIAAALRALDSKLHIVLTLSEPGPCSLDLCERIAPADLLSLLRKPLHAPEIEQFILSAEARHVRETSDEAVRSQARDVAAEALRDLPIALIVAERDRRIVVATGAVTRIFPEYRGGLVPGTYLPEALAWIARPEDAEETDRSHDVRELCLGDGRWLVAAAGPTPGGGGMGLFLDVSDQKREQARRELKARTALLAESLTAFRRGVSALLRESARPRGGRASDSNGKSATGVEGFAGRLQGLIAQLDTALVPAGERDSPVEQWRS